MKKVKRTTLRNKADKLFSAMIREAGYCSKCGSTSNLQCAHIISRAYYGTRWNPFNAVCLCFKCHLYFTHHPLEWEEWIGLTMDGRLISELKQEALSHIHRGEKVNYEEVIHSLAHPKKEEGG